MFVSGFNINLQEAVSRQLYKELCDIQLKASHEKYTLIASHEKYTLMAAGRENLTTKTKLTI